MNKRQKMMESKWAESSWAHRVQLENDMAHAHTHTHKLNYPMFVPYFESGPASTASHIPCLCHAISLCLCIFSSTSCSMVAIWHQIEVAGQKRQRSTEKKCGLCDMVLELYVLACDANIAVFAYTIDDVRRHGSRNDAAGHRHTAFFFT